MQSVEQHSYRETKEQNSNGCKLIVKKDGMLDSLDARERSYDNSVQGTKYGRFTTINISKYKHFSHKINKNYSYPVYPF